MGEMDVRDAVGRHHAPECVRLTQLRSLPLWLHEALRKLAERGISVDEVTEVFKITPVIWIENPNPRAADSR